VKFIRVENMVYMRIRKIIQLVIGRLTEIELLMKRKVTEVI